MITMIRKDLQKKGLRPDAIIEKYRAIDSSRHSMKHTEFKRALKEFVPDLMPVLTDKKLGLLVHYLVREEFQMVSFNKLSQAFNLADNDEPLRQDKINEINESLNVVRNRLEGAERERLPLEVQHFLHWIAMHGITIAEMFGVFQITEDKVIAQAEFEQKCAERGYVPSDPLRLH